MTSENIITTGGVYEHFNLPWIHLSEKNESNNFQVSWKSFAGGTADLLRALKSTEIDIAILLTEGLLLDILKNNELKLVAFHVMNPLHWAIHVRNSDDISNFQNKRFAISRMGSGSHTMARFLLNQNEVDYDPGLMVEVGSLEGGLKALQENKADVFLWEKYTTQPFLNEFGLKSIGEVKTPWPPFSVAVRKYFYKNRLNLLEEILNKVRMESIKIIEDKNTPNEIQMRWNIDNEKGQLWLDTIQWDDHLLKDAKILAPVLQNMKKAGLLEDNTQPELILY